MDDKLTPQQKDVTRSQAETPPDPAIAAVRAMMQDMTIQGAGDEDLVQPDPASMDKSVAKDAPKTTPKPAPQTKTSAPKAHSQPRKPLFRNAARQTRDVSRLLFKFIGQLLRHRMTPKVLAVLVCAVTFILYPFFTVVLVFVTLMTGTIVYLSVGPEQVEAFAARRFEKLRTRDPARAEVLHKRAIRGVAVLNKAIDCLPERWTSGLYLPDFEDSTQQSEKMQIDPFERLGPEAKAMAKAALDQDLHQALHRPSAREPRAEGKEYRYRRL